MYEYTPKPNRKTGIAVAIICFVSALLLFMPTGFDLPVSTLLRSIGLWLFLCGFLVLERFVLTRYIYRIEYNDEICDLVIIETRLNRQRTVCRVASRDFVRLYELKQGKPKPVYEKKTKRYNYCPDLFGTGRYVLLLNDDGRPASVRFCPDEKMLSLIYALSDFGQQGD